MIRIICQEVDATAQAGAGHPAVASLKTFLVDAPELEAWLDGQNLPQNSYIRRCIIGAEDVPTEGGYCRTCGSLARPIVHTRTHGYVCPPCLEKARQKEGFEA